MTRQEKNLDKKRPGRPAIGRGVQVNAMLRPETTAALDVWRAKQEDEPTRPEAVRRLVEKGLTNDEQPRARIRKRDVVKGIGVYRALVELPDDVSDDELRPLVFRLLSDASQSLNVGAIAFEVASQIRANFPRAFATQQDLMRLAEAMMELVRRS
jgi:hypothetical protein